MTWKPKDSFSSPNEGRCPHCGTPLPRIKYLLSSDIVCENCGTELEVIEEAQLTVHVTIRGNPGW